VPLATLPSTAILAGFGVELDCINQHTNHFQLAFDYVQTASERRTRFGSFWKVLEALRPDRQFAESLAYLNNTTEQIIRQRQSEPLADLQQRPDLLSQLISERADNGQCKHSSKYLRDFVMNFMIAGMCYSYTMSTDRCSTIELTSVVLVFGLLLGRDTTAMLLTWTMYLVAQHPQVEQRLLQEMDEVLGTNHQDTTISWNALKDLTYMKQVLQEALRLYPPVPLEGFAAFEGCGYLTHSHTHTHTLSLCVCVYDRLMHQLHCIRDR
jgi:cytochrome P450